MTPFPPWSRININPGHCRFELRIKALRVDASVERHSNGRWFWVAMVQGVAGKSAGSSRIPETMKRSAVRWIRAELGRFEAEVEHARKLAQLGREADKLEKLGHLEREQMDKIRAYILEIQVPTDRALAFLFHEAKAEIAAANERLEREIAEVSA
jgi:hypothetical protein